MTPTIQDGYIAAAQAKAEPFDIRDARLGGRPILAHIGRTMVDLSLEDTTDGASSVRMTVRDGDYSLLRSGVLVPGVELIAWKRTWVFVGMDETGERAIGAIFESKIVNTLKRDRRRVSMKATRPTFTRAVCGRLPVTIPDESRQRGMLVGALGVGLGESDKVTIRGRAATREQRILLDELLQAAYEAGASNAELVALVAAAIFESNALNVLPGGGRNGVGFDATSRGGPLRLPVGVAPTVNARSVRDVARWFVASSVQGSPQGIAASRLGRSAASYVAYVAQAKLIVTAFTKVGAQRVAGPIALVKKHLTEKLALSVGPPQGEVGESRWEAINRVWTDLGWYVFEGANGLVVVSGQHLRVAKPDVVLHPEYPGVLSPSFSTDESFDVTTASCSLLEGELGSVRAGMVVDFVAFGEGSGRYVITSLRRSSASSVVEVDLESPRDVVSAQDSGTRSSDSSFAPSGDVPERIAKMIAKANQIDGGPYSQLVRNGPSYDCSSAVCTILMAGGFINVIGSTLTLNNYAESGRGQYFTVYSGGGGGNAGHAWIVFEKAAGFGKERMFMYSGSRSPHNGWKPNILRDNGTNKGERPRHVHGF